MGQINIYQPTLFEELVSMFFGVMVNLLICGLFAAFVCLFKKRVPSFLKTLSYGAIPLSIPCIAMQIWTIITDPEQRSIASGSPIFLGIFVLGLLSWIYLLRREDRKV